jgi:hypothetical protein
VSVGFILNHEGPELTGQVASTAWNALQTRNFFSMSVLWGVLGPKILFQKDSPYYWIPYGFLLGAGVMFLVYLVHRWKPRWNLEERFNPVLFCVGAVNFPVYTTTNMLSSGLVAFFL